MEGVTPHTMDDGLKLIRDCITKHLNPIMQRAILITKMPPTDYDDWRTWGLALKEQSQRCGWGPRYTWKVATLDALLYQCPDPMWKKKILAGKWDFQTALDYGIREVTAKKMGADLSKKGSTQEKAADLSKKGSTQEKADDIAVNKVGEGRGPFCKKCVGNHATDNCPGKGKPCGACGQKGHYPKSFTCPNHANHNPSQRGNGRNNGCNERGNGRGGQSRRSSGNQGTGTISETKTKGGIPEGGRPLGP